MNIIEYQDFSLCFKHVYIKWYHLSAAGFDQHSDEKPKVEMKTESSRVPDGSVMLADGFPGSNCNLPVLDCLN